MSYIYKITNNINNKVYIGKTDQAPEVRWKQHQNNFNKKLEYVKPLYFSMRKHGIENFSFEILGKFSRDELSIKEIEFIKLYNAYGKCGYNATLGGDGKKIYEDINVLNIYNKVHHISETASLLNISRITVRSILKRNNIDTSNNISRNAKTTSVLQYSLTDIFIKEFTSMKQAVSELKLNKKASAHISKCCNGKRISAYGFKWKYK
jgi:group I intron endonuclease